MPMIVSRNSRSGKPTVNAPATIPNAFTGTVWLDPVLAAEGVSIGNVNFMPRARTYWHTHEKGQILRVLAGTGWVCDKGAEPTKIGVGDIVWCPPGTTHWHGADDESYMVHQATSFGGVEWYDEVKDEEYGKKAGET